MKKENKNKTIWLVGAGIIVVLFVGMFCVQLFPLAFVRDEEILCPVATRAPNTCDLYPPTVSGLNVYLEWRGDSEASIYKIGRQKAGEIWMNIKTLFRLTDYSCGQVYGIKYTDVLQEYGVYAYRIKAINSKGSILSDKECIRVEKPDGNGDGNGDENGDEETVNKIPTATIISVTPTNAYQGEGIMITFEGRGTDPDGHIIRYKWKSDIDGEICRGSLYDIITKSADDFSVGTHTIIFNVRDNDGDWGRSAKTTLHIFAQEVEEEDDEEDDGVVPTIPILSINTAVSRDGNIILTWTIVASADSYRVYRSKDSGKHSLIAEDLTMLTNTYQETITFEGIYNYYVVAVNSAGESGHSNSVEVTVSFQEQPPSNGDDFPIQTVMLIVGAISIGTVLVYFVVKTSKSAKMKRGAN